MRTHPKKIRRVDVRELEKVSLLEPKPTERKKAAAAKTEAVRRFVRAGRWM
jgi:hypothetical protein